MQLLYASPSLGFGHSLRIALEGEGIPAFCSDADASVAGIAGPLAGPQTRVYVSSDDFPRAVEILEGLLSDDEAPAVERAVARSPLQRDVPAWALIAGSACAIAAMGAMLTQ